MDRAIIWFPDVQKGNVDKVDVEGGGVEVYVLEPIASRNIQATMDGVASVSDVFKIISNIIFPHGGKTQDLTQVHFYYESVIRRGMRYIDLQTAKVYASEAREMAEAQHDLRIEHIFKHSVSNALAKEMGVTLGEVAGRLHEEGVNVLDMLERVKDGTYKRPSGAIPRSAPRSRRPRTAG